MRWFQGEKKTLKRIDLNLPNRSLCLHLEDAGINLKPIFTSVGVGAHQHMRESKGKDTGRRGGGEGKMRQL